MSLPKHASLVVALTLCAMLPACKKRAEWERGLKVAHLAARSRISSLDPTKSSNQYASIAQSFVYEPLYTYKYLVRPYEITPLLAADMPQVSEDGLTYTIGLRRGVRFHDDPCFQSSQGQGRELVARDVIYSLKRMADRDNDPLGWWLLNDRFVGFDAFQQRMNARAPGEAFQWDAEVEGLRALDDTTIQLKLLRPYPQLLYILAMGYTSAVPRECTEYYGSEFARHPVGTGPFRMESWSRGNRIVYRKNPTYREDFYPSEAIPEFRDRGLLEAAGQRIPFLDAVVLHIFEQDQPMWLKFRVGDIHMVNVAAEYYDAAFGSDGNLRPAFADDGLGNYDLALTDMVYRGFNMEDPIIGLPGGERARLVRQAISLATDLTEINDAFYNNKNILYDGPIPPGLDGYEPGVISPYRGRNIDKALELLERAGYPNGEGLPPINVEHLMQQATVEQIEMFVRQQKALGITFNLNSNSFPELDDKIARKKAQMFGMAWGSDYPDAENNLQLFYGPNESPGSNNFNYKNPEYDRLFERARTMQPGPGRTALYRRMRDIVIQDVPVFGTMARTRNYVWSRKLKNVQPTETWYRWMKYLDLEEH